MAWISSPSVLADTFDAIADELLERKRREAKANVRTQRSNGF
jgi:hypothetical protein